MKNYIFKKYLFCLPTILLVLTTLFILIFLSNNLSAENYSTDEQGNPDNALQRSLKALSKNPDNVKALQGAGYGYLKKGEYGLAEEYLTRALKINPQYAMAWKNLGWVYDNAGNYELMLDAFDKAILYDNSNDTKYRLNYIGKAKAHFCLGEFHSSLSVLQKVAETGPNSMELKKIRGLMVLCHLALGNNMEAKKILKGKSTTGISLSERDGKVFLEQVLPFGPAQIAGLQKGDRVMSINNKDIQGLSPQQVGQIIHNVPFGQEISFVIAREEKQLVMKVRLGQPVDHVSSDAAVLTPTEKGEENITTRKNETDHNEPEIKRVFKQIRDTQYMAMIIGNNNYRHLDKLKTAIKDAKEVQSVLENSYGFTTQLLLDATRDEIVTALNKVRSQTGPTSNLLIYYAGHGIYDDVSGKAYWLPVDARNDIDTEWIIVDTITSNLKRMQAKHILVVSDSCYAGTLTRKIITRLESDDDRPRYLQRIQAKNSRTLLASGGNEPVADSGNSGHSVFAGAFLKGLREIKEDLFTAEELYISFIKEQVAGKSEQLPEYNIIRNSGHDGGEFVFVKLQPSIGHP